MPAMHVITVDPDTGLVEIGIDGFWAVDRLAAFSRDLVAATTRARSRGKPSVVLCDYTRALIQPQEVIGALQQMVNDPIHKSRRVAFFTERQLATMQVRRIASMRDDMRVFDERTAALAWLMEPPSA